MKYPNDKSILITFFQNANSTEAFEFYSDHAFDRITGTGDKKNTDTYRNKHFAAVQQAIKELNDYTEEDKVKWVSFLMDRENFKKAAREFKVKKIDKAAYDFAEGIVLKRIGDPWIQAAVRLDDSRIKKEKEASKFKTANFVAVCWSVAKYKDNYRLAPNCEKHSGLICIDIDKLSINKLSTLWNQILLDKHTHLCFISPSGCGIKVIIKIEADAEKHLLYFKSIEQYYQNKFGIKIDPSGKDVSRLCFICNDDDACFKAESEMFPEPLMVEPNPEPVQLLKKKQEKALQNDTVISANDVFEFTQTIRLYVDGNRNNFVHLYACNCNRKGLSQADCESFALEFANDLDTKEVKATVNSAYQNNKLENGKFAKKIRPVSNDNSVASRPPRSENQKPGNSAESKILIDKTILPPAHEQAAGRNRPDTRTAQSLTQAVQFWQTSMNEKTGKESVSLNYSRFYLFLEQTGYANLKIDNQNVELIHMKDNIVSPVMINNSRNDVKMQMNEYCKDQELDNVLEMLHRGQDKYFARKQFINIGYKKIDFLKDDKDVSYHFHSNCVVEVRAEGITVRDYSLGEKSLWASQINPRPFVRVPIETMLNIDDRISADNTNCEFAKYQILASCHPDTNVSADVANKRYMAHATSFGYLVNNYKPSIGKAIVGVDHHKAIDRSEQNGRTGKGILSKAIGYITKRFPVDGRKFDPKDQSVFEGLTMDSKVITVDDCHEKFDFGHFFVPITEDFTVRKMYLGYITVPYEMSPKWYFNTNFTFKGDGDSFAGRQHIVEFDNFFNKKYTPIHYFKHSLFRDWDDKEWNLFFNYAYECDALYKLMDLVEYAEGNYMERKLINECPQEFIDFVDATDETTEAWLNVVRNQWFDKKKFLEGWNTESRALNMNQASSKLIYSMLKKYCQSKGVGFYTKKSNGTEVYFIGDRLPVPMQTGIKEVVLASNIITTPVVEQKEIF